MIFIFIWARNNTPYLGWISSGLRGMKEGHFALHLRDMSKG
jgi:hypothetical protein